MNPAQTLAQLERECNPYGNGLDVLPASSLVWTSVEGGSMQVRVSCEGPSGDRCRRAREAGEVLGVMPMRVSATGGEDAPTPSAAALAMDPVPTRSPLLCFKVINAAGQEAACVAIHVMPLPVEPDLVPEDRYFFYIPLAQISPRT